MTRRDRLALTVIVVAAVLAAFWFLGLGSKRKDADSLGAKVTAQETRRDAARQNLAAYQAARGSYRTNYTTVARLGKAVPAENDVPSLIYQVDSTAKAAGIDFQSLKVSGNAGTPTPPAPAPAPTSSSDSDASATTASTAPAGAASFTTVPFSFTFTGSFFKLSEFFERLQNYIKASNKRVAVSGRLMTLDSIDLAAGPDGFPQITATAEATTYLLPADQGLFNGATATSPSTQAAGAHELRLLARAQRRIRPLRRCDRGGSPLMTFVRDLITDLVTKRLWPIAVVLVVAIVAVPVIISKPAPDNGPAEAAAKVTAAQAAKESAAAQPVVTLAATVTTKSKVKGLHAKDPFRRANALGTSLTVTPGGANDGGAPIGGSGGSGGGAGGSSSGGSGDTGSTQTPSTSTPPKTYTTYDVDLRFNEAGKSVKIRRNIARLTALPSSLDPVLVYMGLLADGNTAVFLVNADATPQGDATCKPKKSECTYVYLHEGDTEFFDVGSGANAIQYELKVLHIDPHKTTSKSEAKAVYARESGAGRRALRKATASVATHGLPALRALQRHLRVTPESPVTTDADAHASMAFGASLGM